MSTFYIATTLKNAVQARDLKYILEDKGHECTYDWTSHCSVYHEGEDRVRQVAENEALGVMDADVLIVLLPGGRGTFFEMGCAIALGMDVFLYNSQPVNEETCSFEFHPGVMRSDSKSIEDLAVEVDIFLREDEDNIFEDEEEDGDIFEDIEEEK